MYDQYTEVGDEVSLGFAGVPEYLDPSERAVRRSSADGEEGDDAHDGGDHGGDPDEPPHEAAAG